MLTLFFFSFFAGAMAMASSPLLPLLFAIGIARDSQLFRRALLLGFVISWLLLQAIGYHPMQERGSLPPFFQLLLSISWVIAAGWLYYSSSRATPVEEEQIKGYWHWARQLAFFCLGATLALLWHPYVGVVLHALHLLVSLRALPFTGWLMLLCYGIGGAFVCWLLLMALGKLMQRITKIDRLAPLQKRLPFLIIALLLPSTLRLAFFPATATAPAFLADWEKGRHLHRRLTQLIGDATGGLFFLRPPQDPHRSTAIAMLPNIGRAPKLEGLSCWYNGDPLEEEQLRGRPTLIHFWSYSCLSCLHTLPHLRRWHREYGERGLLILAIQAPEFAFEANSDHLANAIEQLKIRYPVALDATRKSWEAFGNLYWPTNYLLDSEGNIRYVHFGEGDYLRAENAIRQLLGLSPLEGLVEPSSRKALTPEIYLGYDHAANYPPDWELQLDQPVRYQSKQEPMADQVTLDGLWCVEEDGVVSASEESTIYLNFLGRQVHAVLSGIHGDPIHLEIDGRPLTKKQQTPEFDGEGHLYVDGPRNYWILDVGRGYGRHLLAMKLPPGVKLHTFAFDAAASSSKEW